MAKKLRTNYGFKISAEPYKQSIFVYVGDDTAKLKQFLARTLKMPKENIHEEMHTFAELLPWGNCGLTSYFKNGLLLLLVYFNGKYDGQVADTIAHETLHGVQYILEERGLKFDENTKESYNYYLGFLVRQITDKILNNGK